MAASPSNVCFERFGYDGRMSGAIAHEQAERLRAAVDEVLPRAAGEEVAASAPRDALLRLVDVLESNADAAVFPADGTVGTGEAATVLGVSRMTVVRLIERGELRAQGGSVHRRIPVSELARYRAARSHRRRTALDAMAREIDSQTPADQIVTTR